MNEHLPGDNDGNGGDDHGKGNDEDEVHQSGQDEIDDDDKVDILLMPTVLIIAVTKKR